MKSGPRKVLKGDNITQVRRRNRAMILELILRSPGICRRDIVHKTGLTASAVSDITRELINEGLVKEETASPGSENRKVGRSPVGLHIAENAAWVMGALLYTDRVVVGLSNLVGQLVFSREIKADCSSVEVAQAALIRLAKEANGFAENAKTTVIGMGVSIPGMVVPETGSVRYSAILNWQDVKLVERLKRDIPYPIVIDNDVRGMALARYWFQTQRHEQFLMVYVGQGIACCSVRNGSIWVGNSGAAGQIGHSILDPRGPECACGQRGCFEAMVSTRRLMEMMAEEIRKGAVSSLSLDDINRKQIDMSLVCSLIEEGDEAARGAIRRLGRYLGIGLSNLIKIYDPQALILVGDVFRASRFSADLIKQEMYSHFLSQQVSPEIVIEENPSLPLLGSAIMALERFVFRPPEEHVDATAFG